MLSFGFLDLEGRLPDQPDHVAHAVLAHPSCLVVPDDQVLDPVLPSVVVDIQDCDLLVSVDGFASHASPLSLRPSALMCMSRIGCASEHTR